jgi:site-specific DNA-methyltransferase (adenine-specific)
MPSNITVFSSQTVEWATPQRLFDDLNAEFKFTLDPCSTHKNAKCVRHFTKGEDGLAQDWGLETVFMNPPYGKPEGPCRPGCTKQRCRDRGYHT